MKICIVLQDGCVVVLDISMILKYVFLNFSLCELFHTWVSAVSNLTDLNNKSFPTSDLVKMTNLPREAGVVQ